MKKDDYLNQDFVDDEELEKILKEGLVEYKAGKAKSLDFSKPIHNQLMED